MKITVIYDNNDKGITYKSVQFILKEIQSNNINTIVNEFSIQDNFDSYFFDCYSACNYCCIYESEMTDCPYPKIIKNLSFNLNNSDMIILASSSSKHNISSTMYKILESLSYKWLPHRLNDLMVNKIALAISNTTSFTTFSYANMTLSRILRFWGINKRSIFSKSLSKYNFDNLPQKKYLKLTSELTKLSLQIVNKYRQTSAVIIPNFSHKNKTYVHHENKASIIKLPKNSSQKKYLIKKITHQKIL